MLRLNIVVVIIIIVIILLLWLIDAWWDIKQLIVDVTTRTGSAVMYDACW